MLMNVSHTYYELLPKFSFSYKLLKIFFQTPNHFIMNFVPIFLQISLKKITNFLQSSNVLRTFQQVL
jgi:hypothetical protein